LANLDPEELHRRYPDRVLKVRTPRTIDTWDRLLDELSMVRRDGFALNLEEGDDGIAAVGYPIRRDSNSPLAALAVAAPAFRVNREDAVDRIVPAMARAASEIERQMRTGDIRHDSTRVVTDTDDYPRS
jgi:DNA-binding IclR family transcriptional regulator